MCKVTVLGAGHWGLALADVLANNNCIVKVWARRQEVVDSINLNNESSYFKDIKLNKNIVATNDLSEAFEYSDFIVISLPIVVIYDLLLPYILRYSNKSYLFTSKGLYKGKSMSSLFYEQCPFLKLSVLSGPSFSEEVMEHMFTAVTIASKDEVLAKEWQSLFSTPYFRSYTTTDIIGVEYLGAIKNVFAIICGMLDGNKMGCNTKNAMITRGLSEIKKIMSFVGGKPATLDGLSGIGDIMLTCNSFESRNYSYGYNYKPGDDTSSQQNGTIEGLNTIKEIYHIAISNNIDMPIISALYKVLFEGTTVREEAQKLMLRESKSE